MDNSNNSNNLDNFGQRPLHLDYPNLQVDSQGKIIDPIRIQDNINNVDPSKFPDARLDRHNLHLRNLAVDYKLLGIHSQGYPDSPIMRGYLYENNEHANRRILPLFGQETYPNSRRYRYLPYNL